jgi:hypothetical protein
MNVIRVDPAEETLADRAAAVLLHRWGRRVRGLRVEAHADGLVLYGRATSYYEKQLAQHAAAEAAGLPVRANAIVVVGPA